MNRYLCILFCLDVCFCNNFIDNYDKYVKRHVDRQGHSGRNGDRDVQFDLAEFVRTEKSELDSGHESNNNYMTLSNIRDNFNINDNDLKDNDLNKNLKELLSMEATNGYDATENLVDDQVQMLVDDDAVHNPEKKCSSTTTSRKQNNMKINGDAKTKSVTKKEISDLKSLRKKSKNGKKKFGKRLSNKHVNFGNTDQQIIHNSRQYYQSKAKIDSTVPTLSKKEITNFDYDKLILEDVSQYQVESDIMDYRRKRDIKEDKDRKLEELKQLEEKVDKVKIDDKLGSTAKDENKERASQLPLLKTIVPIFTKRVISNFEYDSPNLEDMSQYEAEANNEDCRRKRQVKEDKQKILKKLEELEQIIDHVQVENKLSNSQSQASLESTELSSQLLELFKTAVTPLTGKEMLNVNYQSLTLEDVPHYQGGSEGDSKYYRRKRNDFEEKARRLKELEEVEKKVDNVQIDKLAKTAGPPKSYLTYL